MSNFRFFETKRVFDAASGILDEVRKPVVINPAYIIWAEPVIPGAKRSWLVLANNKEGLMIDMPFAELRKWLCEI